MAQPTENNTLEIARRDTLEKSTIKQQEAVEFIQTLLHKIQDNIYKKAKKYKEKNTYIIDDYDQFKKQIETEGGFIYAHWDGTEETEQKIKTETKATIRCIPVDSDNEPGKCIYSGKPSDKRVVFAKAY